MVNRVALLVRIHEFDSRQHVLFYLGSVVESVRTGVNKVQPLVDEVQECLTCIAVKTHTRRPERDGKIIIGHRQDGKVAVGGIDNLAR